VTNCAAPPHTHPRSNTAGGRLLATSGAFQGVSLAHSLGGWGFSLTHTLTLTHSLTHTLSHTHSRCSVQGAACSRRRAHFSPRLSSTSREFFIDNLLVRIHLIIVMIRWTGLAPWGFEFPFPGSLTSAFLQGAVRWRHRGHSSPRLSSTSTWTPVW